MYVGIDELSRWEMNLYPNPASDQVIVESNIQSGVIEVYDASGRVVLSEAINQNRIHVNVSQFESGMYQFVITGPNGESTVGRVMISR